MYMLLRNRISFIASKVGIRSISKEFAKEKFDRNSADVLNSNISTKSKSKKLE